MPDSSRFNVPITSVTTQSNLEFSDHRGVKRRGGIRGCRTEFRVCESHLRTAEANAAKSDADLVRYEQLVAKEDISHQQYDQAVAAAKANRSGVVSGKANVQAAEQAVRQAQGKLLQARADLRSAADRTGTGFDDPGQGTRGQCPGARTQGTARSSRPQSQLYSRSFSSHRNYRQEDSRSGPEHRRGFRLGVRYLCAQDVSQGEPSDPAVCRRCRRAG